MKILFIGPLLPGSTTLQRCDALSDLGYEVTRLDSSNPVFSIFKKIINKLFYILNTHYDWTNVNKKLKSILNNKVIDLVWIEKGLKIKPSSIMEFKNYKKLKFISYSCDDMMIKQNQSKDYLNSISLYDFHFTTKSYNVKELEYLGAKNVLFFINAYDNKDYRPRVFENYKFDISFLGGYEKDRLDQMLYLAKKGLKINIYGPSWEGKEKTHPNLKIKSGWVQSKDASRIFNITKINLHFLRKLARDLQTTRTMEIPGSAGFMLAERTVEHSKLFEEGKEADFFSNKEELFNKINYYLNNEDKRLKISKMGYKRCVSSGYDYKTLLNKIIDTINKL